MPFNFHQLQHLCQTVSYRSTVEEDVLEQSLPQAALCILDN